MAEHRDAGVDPRFDPVFQRGYDPAKHGGRSPRATPRHATGPVPVTPLREVPRARAEEPVVAPQPAPERRADAAEAAVPDDLTLRTRNPFRIALLVASIVAIATGAWMIWTRIGEDVYYGGFSGTNQGLLFRSQLIAALPVPLLTGGILGLILWLAIGAMARRESADSDG